MALPGLLLYSLEYDDVRVRRDADRQDQPGDSRQRQRDRDQLHDRQEEDRVDGETEDRDRAEEAVISEEEDRDEQEADQARLEALVERLLAERGRHRALADQLQVDRQRADLQKRREVLGLLDREAAGDLGAGTAVDPVRVLLVVDDRPRDDLLVEDDRERVRRPERLLAALGDPPGDVLERDPALVGEVEGDVRLVVLVEVLLGVGDVVAAELRLVLEDEVTRRRVRVVLLVLDDDRSLRDREDLPVVLRHRLGGIDRKQVALARLRPGDVLAALLLEQVELRPGRRADVVALRVLLGGELDRVVEARRRLLVEVGRRHLLGLRIERDDVRLEVVEVELGGVADLVDRALRVLDVREADLDLVGPERRDLGLGDAEGVDAVADDLDRAVDVLLVDGRVLGARLALVDELGAAAEVEAELRRLRRDHQDRPGQQQQDQRDDRDVRAARAHASAQRTQERGVARRYSGVRTSSIPPSSS